MNGWVFVKITAGGAIEVLSCKEQKVLINCDNPSNRWMGFSAARKLRGPARREENGDVLFVLLNCED